MPYIDHGEKSETPSVPYQPIPLETGDMKPPLMHGARPLTAGVDVLQTPVLTPFRSVEEIPVTDKIAPQDAYRSRIDPYQAIDELSHEVLDLKAAHLTVLKERDELAVELQRLKQRSAVLEADVRHEENIGCCALLTHLIAKLQADFKGPIPGYALEPLVRALHGRIVTQ